MKDFLTALFWSLAALIGGVLLFAFTIGAANAAEVPNIQCDSANLNDDYTCMKANWRPKKQVSYDTAKPYCYSNGGNLQGQGEIVLSVDDAPYIFKIDCK